MMGIQSDILKAGWKDKKIRIRSLVKNADDNLNMSHWQFVDPENPAEEISFDEWYKSQRVIILQGDFIQALANYKKFVTRSSEIMSNIVKPRVIEPLREMMAMLNDAENIVENQEKEILDLKMLNGGLQDENEELANKNIVLREGMDKMKGEMKDIKIDYKILLTDCNEILERAVKKINFNIEQFNEDHNDVIDNIEEIDQTSKDKEVILTQEAWKKNFIIEKGLEEKFAKWTKEVQVTRSFNGWIPHAKDEEEKAKILELREEYKKRLEEKLLNPPDEDDEEEQDIPDVEKDLDFSSSGDI